MSETTVSTTVAFLFGGMIFLLAYTRLGGLPTVGLALAILVVYLALEAWAAWRAVRRSRSDAAVAEIRWNAWKLAEMHRWIDWAFTPWSDPEFTDIHDYRKADRQTHSTHRDLPIK